ncbi:MAG: EamA family transporter [Deferribacteraceae bacterium]|jgi:drug/metabolite transporter (DMT)-like permease|nr:EamA family transporter [Deferribacteraceae bacterium]
MKVILALISVYIFWGTEYFIVKLTVSAIPPLLLGGVVATFSGAILCIATIANKTMRPTAKDIKNAFLCGFFLIALSSGLIPLLTTYLDSGLVALIFGLSPAAAISIEWLILRQARPSAITLIGVLLGFLGLACTVVPALTGNLSVSLIGIAIGFIDVVAWGVGMIIARHAKFTISSTAVNGLQLLFSGLLLLAASVVAGELSNASFDMLGRADIISLFYLVIFSYAVGFTIYMWLLENARLPIVSTTAYVCPVIAVFLGVTLDGEAVTPYYIATGVFIILSLLFTSKRAS